ncbi:MAG: hypothetical protein DHS20C02_09840 [Micavibrio sp.]|nr:MAG: hypothetical protein DHS20C02_09840 [Micavibrio sp.]
MLSSQPTQFSLADDGQILWQSDASNPIAGAPIAAVSKGDGILSPGVALLESDLIKEQDKDAVIAFIGEWLKAHIAQVLEPLVALGKENEQPEGPVREIATQIYAAMGILPRENIDALIAQLDTDGRSILRSKRIKLGPILIFLPDLNKPAAVRLKGLLWNLWESKALPAKVPPDGIVSLKMEDKDFDSAFYRVIGYPVYGPRAIRIDMLDRVISAVYDHAKDGKFQARHEMAEWLGSSLEDLYLILEAMGHKKVFDPADQKVEEVDGEKIEIEKPKVVEKPELATFRLKKGKAFEAEKPVHEKKPAYKKSEQKPGKKPKKKAPPKKEPRVMQVDAPTNPDDSPFAILEQLKSKSNGQ